MKKHIIGLDVGTLTFTAAADTLVFAGIANFDPRRVLFVTNITRKAVMYASEMGADGLGGTWSAVTATGGTLTLDLDTVAYADADIVRCEYQTPSYESPPSQDVNFPYIVAPQSGPSVLSAPGVIAAQVVPGGFYTVCISIDQAVLGAGSNQLASCTTAVDNVTVAYTGTAPSIGQLLAGTGITPGTYIKTVNPGTGFTMSLPANAAGTVTLNVTAGAFSGAFEYSRDSGATWLPTTAIPRGFQFDSGPTATAVAPGLYGVLAPNTATNIRFNLTSIALAGVTTALTALALRIRVDSFDRASGITSVPFVSYVAATPGTFPLGIPFIMPIDTSYMGDVIVDITTLTGSSQTISWRQSNDPSGVRFSAVFATQTQTATPSSATTNTGAGSYRIVPPGRYFYAFWSAGTAVSAMTLSGACARLGFQPSIAPTHLLTANYGVGITQVGTNTVIAPSPQGASAARALQVVIAGSTSAVDATGVAMAAASGSTTVYAGTTDAGGAVCAFDVNVTAWTVGSSTGLRLYLQESPDNGTTWYDIWECETITATGRRRIPGIPVYGRRRFRWSHLSGTATTATVTITSSMHPGPATKVVQWFDRASGVTSGTAAPGNGVPYDITACKALNFAIDAGTAVAPATFKVQMTTDGNVWYDASMPVACPASATTVIPLIAGVCGRSARFVCTAGGTSALINAGHIYGAN